MERAEAVANECCWKLLTDNKFDIIHCCLQLVLLFCSFIDQEQESAGTSKSLVLYIVQRSAGKSLVFH
jgi:hypothetical protein